MDRVPTFALLIVRLDGWYQSRVWHGVSTAARLLGVRLVALVGSAYGDPEGRGGPPEIYRLAESERIDGYLPLVGALANFEGIASVERLLGSLPPRPTVCIGMGVPGYPLVVPDGGGIDLVVRHLVEAHGTTQIGYIGGPHSNPDANRRLSDFVKAMDESGLQTRPDWMIEGDFSPDTAYQATAKLVDLEALPQAIVCANDAMALGVRKLCKERGVRIPEDLLLTGYDDIEESSTSSPPLTTVDASTYQVGFRSVEILYDIFHGGGGRCETVSTGIVVRRSCGCRNGASSMHLPRLLAEAAGVPHSLRLREIGNQPSTGAPFLARLEVALEQADHAELNLWEERLFDATRPTPSESSVEFLMQAQSIVSRARHNLDLNRRQALQILLREQFSAVQKLVAVTGLDDLPQRLLDAFAPLAGYHMRILLFNRDCSPIRSPFYVDQPFRLEIDLAGKRILTPSIDPLLPAGPLPVANWITLSLALGDEYFGVVQVRDWLSNELFLESLRHSLSMSLSLVRKSAMEHNMREELRKLSQRDELTGVLNRRGLLEHGQLLVSNAVRGGSRIGVVLCDLDGLKSINDNHGHADGDLAIQCLARALEDGFRQSDVVGRLGGDEFAVITLVGADVGLKGAIERVREALERRSKELGRPWVAKTSAGWMLWEPGDGDNLEEALSRADTELYQDKRQRKGVSSSFLARTDVVR